MESVTREERKSTDERKRKKFNKKIEGTENFQKQQQLGYKTFKKKTLAVIVCKLRVEISVKKKKKEMKERKKEKKERKKEKKERKKKEKKAARFRFAVKFLFFQKLLQTSPEKHDRKTRKKKIFFQENFRARKRNHSLHPKIETTFWQTSRSYHGNLFCLFVVSREVEKILFLLIIRFLSQERLRKGEIKERKKERGKKERKKEGKERKERERKKRTRRKKEERKRKNDDSSSLKLHAFLSPSPTT